MKSSLPYRDFPALYLHPMVVVHTLYFYVIGSFARSGSGHAPCRIRIAVVVAIRSVASAWPGAYVGRIPKRSRAAIGAAGRGEIPDTGGGDAKRCRARSALVDMDDAVEGGRGRLSIDQMLEMAVGVVGEGSVSGARHPADGSAGAEGRYARYVGEVRFADVGQDIAGGEGGCTVIGCIRFIVGFSEGDHDGLVAEPSEEIKAPRYFTGHA